jgi:hypothetical protein
MNEDANTMLWDRFVKSFKEHHIPKSVMKLKLEEFMSLQQVKGSMDQEGG